VGEGWEETPTHLTEERFHPSGSAAARRSHGHDRRRRSRGHDRRLLVIVCTTFGSLGVARSASGVMGGGIQPWDSFEIHTTGPRTQTGFLQLAAYGRDGEGEAQSLVAAL
jgi:hypothetical protein